VNDLGRRHDAVYGTTTPTDHIGETKPTDAALISSPEPSQLVERAR
jgi:hypothetical protein